MIIIFAIALLLLIVLYFLSKNKYFEYIEPLNENEFRLKKLLPIGFYLLDRINYKYSSKYDRNLLNKTAELNGGVYAHYYLRVHWANKITFELLLLALLLFINAAMGKTDMEFLGFSLSVLVITAFATDKELDNKVNKRRISMQLDFPDFLNTLTLLINAGMTVSGAWTRIAADTKKNTPLFVELRNVMAEITNGKSEIAAYEEFAKRCRLPEVTKFVSVITQNLKKGNSELVDILKFQSKECWEMRKHAAKRIGEEASSKALFPMMLMFLAVVLVVVTPAIIGLIGSV
ncbi:MAG: type II secretion system F family protein [Bacillota bacterium]|nr:type II secretion system F family protein [Bacillota bacterium]